MLGRLQRDLRPSLEWPTVAQLDHLASAWLGRAYRNQLVARHAAAFSLGLLATGAPASLQQLAARTHRDGLLHVALCLTVAQRYAGRRLALDGEPMAPLTGSADPIELSAVALWLMAADGACEATAATTAAGRCHDRAIRRVLRRLGADATRRAALGWRYLRHRGGADGRRLLGATRLVEPTLQSVELAARPAPPQGAWLAEAGQLTRAERLALRAAVMRLIVAPCLQTLAARPRR